jgi:hypothetical protein
MKDVIEWKMKEKVFSISPSLERWIVREISAAPGDEAA